jgi:hypothetical protein
MPTKPFTQKPSKDPTAGTVYRQLVTESEILMELVSTCLDLVHFYCVATKAIRVGWSAERQDVF